MNVHAHRGRTRCFRYRRQEEIVETEATPIVEPSLPPKQRRRRKSTREQAADVAAIRDKHRSQQEEARS